MNLTIQFYTMLSMIGMGAWVGAALDTYHRFLQRPRRKRWIVFLHDIFFWTVQALIVFYVLLRVNEAELRFYVFIALLCGFAAYQSLLKKLYTACLEAIIQFCVRTYQFFAMLIRNLLIKPIIYLAQALLALFLFLLHMLKIIFLGIYKVLFKLLWMLWKLLFIPLGFLGHLLWKLVPQRAKIFIARYAGFLKQITKVKGIILKWWNAIRTRLGGPRE
ncbi:spore cortex biosynthesis protein YabQ [Ectobacillus ponti]|uniref:Spore cortex biosynthesis protein YabQ n=1 Tax=Ectobacillus ponti TaxID=2961894 RepID=A0AA42BRP2_9BACI|nr:spore cortex biosynthesis protein YabQ [Ectobacillus ponti]MCP8971172.1 spore cortex biosynthesis protein YabQ [Ectobacillus ponti]